MKSYKWITIISAIMAVLSFVLAVCLQYISQSDVAFWINVCLGIFGSSVLTTLTSIVSYCHERTKTLESFLYHTREILSVIRNYKIDNSLSEKMEFFIDYNNFDKIPWDSDFGNVDFIFERITKGREYIYLNIYKPINDFTQAVADIEYVFRYHLATRREDLNVMINEVEKLEKYLYDIQKRKYSINSDKASDTDSYGIQTAYIPKLTFQVRNELASSYYELMYGKRTARKNDAEKR